MSVDKLTLTEKKRALPLRVIARAALFYRRDHKK